MWGYMTRVRRNLPGEEGKMILVIRRSLVRDYSVDEVSALLEMAEDRGFSLEQGSSLEGLTVDELDQLVHMSNPIADS